MCWCTPTMRTPHCGKPTCVPPAGQILTEAHRLHAEIKDLRADIAALRDDAERYRFLRNDFSSASLNIDGNHCWVYRRNFSLLGATLDEAIDKAIAG